MRINSVLIILGMISIQALSQENAVTLSGGYAFANIEDNDLNATGYRINGVFEFNPAEGNFSHGLAFGYIHVKAEEVILNITQTSTVNSFPVYYAPKIMFGSEKIKGFVKGAIGMQIAGLKREGIVTFNDADFGFYGGGGAGIMIFLKENIFLNVEYEIAWASNTYYKDGWMNAAMGGVGFKF